ncbi:trypsin inhibitor ClTI-1-like [Poecilia reticulata]|uniref:trypsin inhibitor ClTI-1-like n=1 Tax=Poecilia reticulata TaxID=8081 RepID=UPI0004A33E1B|nr:PREDICTED: trypsin inhibitor ClTI-1-like [Poecilia reticulata]
MNTMTGRLLLGLLIICVAAVAARRSENMRKPFCANRRIWKCTTYFYPVCGTDERTYDNECLLCKEMHETSKNILVAKPGRC